MNYLLDSNIVSYILKKVTTVNNKLQQATLRGDDLFISCITYYEVKRGLLSINATRQLAELQQFCSDYGILFLDNIAIIEKACEIYVDLRRRGLMIQEQDILIAATAIVRGLILVSNDSDLLNVSGIQLENWVIAEF